MSEKSIEEIKKIEKDHRFLTKNLVDAIWIADAETLRIEYMTESIEKLSGYTIQESINQGLQKRMTPESFQKIKALLDEEKLKFDQGIKTIRSAEIEFIHKNGIPYWCEIRARLIKEPGNILKIVGVTKDITERKKVEQEKNDLIEKLGKALFEKEKLLKENKTLKGLLPICSGCKRIRDEKGKWWPIDAYIEKATETKLNHTICVDCKEAFYGDEAWYQKRKKKME
ncbi:MAG: PAS domain S-box protein [Desulfobacter sp.]|nr:MAG: PAS domain S-box protein [Desulfobacter sp.]|eukprot:Anaeramoba_ignava/a219983_23.p1 GENE.a219983_23~~a219983_23.p1  ORF type:complete len:227 (+),score=18.18 a219983_23:531-1211(+)